MSVPVNLEAVLFGANSPWQGLPRQSGPGGWTRLRAIQRPSMKQTGASSWSQTRGESSPASVWWPGLGPWGAGRAQPEVITWSRCPVGPPPAGIEIGVLCIVCWVGPMACQSPVSQTGFWYVECHLCGGKGAGAGVGGGAVPTRYSWAHLHAQHWFWNQTPGEGLDSHFFRSCSG